MKVEIYVDGKKSDGMEFVEMIQRWKMVTIFRSLWKQKLFESIRLQYATIENINEIDSHWHFSDWIQFL